MPKKDDDRLEMRITNKLSNVGLRAPCRFTVEVHNSTVKIKGKVQFDYQKRAALMAIRSMDGVKGLIDDLKVEAPVRAWEEDEQHGPGSFVPPPESD